MYLNENASVILNAFGDGQVKVGPHGPGVLWYPQVASVKTTQPVTNEASCKIYVGNAPTDDNFVDGTLSGSSGDSTHNVAGSELRSNQFIWAVWHSGDPGAQATLSVVGSLIQER